MAIIVIRDLPENFELDRKAMIAISGGARRGRSNIAGRATFPNTRILNLRPLRRSSGTQLK